MLDGYVAKRLSAKLRHVSRQMEMNLGNPLESTSCRKVTIN